MSEVVRMHKHFCFVFTIPADNGLTPGETAAIVISVFVAAVVILIIAIAATCIYCKCKLIKINDYDIICDWFTRTRKSNLWHESHILQTHQ